MNHNIIANTSVISPFLPIVVFLFLRKRNNTKPLWVIFIYLILTFVFDAIRSVTQDVFLEFYLFRTFTVIEYFCFSYYLYSILTVRFKKWLIPLVGLIIVAINIKYVLGVELVEEFDAVTTSIEAIFIILLSITFFYEVIQNSTVSLIYANKSFWIVTAMLVYLSANLFLFITSKYLTAEERNFYWFINDTSNTLKNILFTIAFILPISENNPPKEQFHSYDEHPFLN